MGRLSDGRARRGQKPLEGVVQCTDKLAGSKTWAQGEPYL
jgi:hypothetical protein